MFLLVAASTVTSSGEIRYYLYIFKLTGLTFCFHQCPLLQRGLVVVIIRYKGLNFFNLWCTKTNTSGNWTDLLLKHILTNVISSSVLSPSCHAIHIIWTWLDTCSRNEYVFKTNLILSMGLQKRKMPATVLKTVPAAFDIWLGEATSSKENCVGIQQSKHSSYIVSLRFHHTFYHTLCWQWCSSAKEVSILQFHREINDVTGGALTDYFNFMPLWWNLTTKSSRVLCEMHHL